MLEQSTGNDFELDYTRERPWDHPHNTTHHSRLAAAQRTAGILITQQMRNQDPAYDAALFKSGVKPDLSFSVLQPDDTTIQEILKVVAQLKSMVRYGKRWNEFSSNGRSF